MNGPVTVFDWSGMLCRSELTSLLAGAGHKLLFQPLLRAIVALQQIVKLGQLLLLQELLGHRLLEHFEGVGLVPPAGLDAALVVE